MAIQGKFAFDAELSEKLKDSRVGIVAAQWHNQYTTAMAQAARQAFLDAGVPEENIFSCQVPGAYELPLGAQYLFEYLNVMGVVAIGCLVKGETPHFHYIADTVTGQLGTVALRHNRPVGYGLLTVDDEQQAAERSGGKHGNKGEEAALAVLQMMQLRQQVKDTPKTAPGVRGMGFGRNTGQ